MIRVDSPEPVQCGSELGDRINRMSVECWGPDQAVTLIGAHPALLAALERTARVAAADAPVLISGETGTGKELFARAIYLLGGTRGPFISVNCAQYVNDQMMASELFGHRKGSFTGAVADHVGVLESAEGGVVCLDEIGELSPIGQAMLLRAIGEREVVPVGASRPKRINTRIIASTNRDLGAMMDRNAFRPDLFFRLNRLRVKVPALRERGDDWRRVADHYLARLTQRFNQPKRFTNEVLGWLESYSWPGNVREVMACVETGYHLSDDHRITLRDIGESLEASARDRQLNEIPLRSDADSWMARDLCSRIALGDGTFWQLISEPFLSRELNRGQAREVIRHGLELSRGSYKELLAMFRLPHGDYLRFMDFLRHHRLKPDDFRRTPATSERAAASAV